MTDLPYRDTDRAPSADEDDTDRHGIRSRPPYSDSQSDLLIRLVEGVEELGRDVRAMRADLRLALEEGRCHARRLTELEDRVGRLESRAAE
jgi:hypothetical protein